MRARTSTLVDGDVGVRLPRGVRLQLTVLDLLDRAADDARYYYTSRLAGEPAGGVDDVHFHPVEPRQLQLSLGRQFR